MIKSRVEMQKINKKSKTKMLLSLLSALAVSWLVLYLYLTISPTVAHETCVDKGGLWLEIEEKRKCYCDTTKDKGSCAAILEDAHKRSSEAKR